LIEQTRTAEEGTPYGTSVGLGKRLRESAGLILENGQALSEARRGVALRKNPLPGKGSEREPRPIKLHHERIPENGAGVGA
jgi:hypothetical protein